ncbi:MAG: ATP-binding cassette domain-containing protein, partial [SAR324 cluster bacterium]|nr:ATP-binding cassette domain-containing protein [SAR324 cluster bacterium]
PLEIVSKSMNKVEKINRARELLSLVGLAEFEKSRPSELSGGMKQRASLCRSLVHKPEVLILDEPFGALDAFTREELWCVLRDLWQERKFTVLLVTHDLIESAFLADRVLVMSNRPGRVIMEFEIPFERPRNLDIRFEKEFVDIVHQLRDQIRTARAA